jgi:hypothetical protein
LQDRCLLQRLTSLQSHLQPPHAAGFNNLHLLCHCYRLQDQCLLQQLASLQSLFFQQQGDWVDLLLEALQQQQQQQRLMLAHGSTHTAAAAAAASRLSPIVAQVLLESAVQQSCLAGGPDAERMSVQVSNCKLFEQHTSFACIVS